MEPVRACPVCTGCGSKRFERLAGGGVRVRCRSCGRVLEL